MLEIKVKRKDCCHSTLRYTHYPTTALVVINTLLELFWHFVFKWSMFWNFIDLRSFLTKFHCRDLRTFSADFFEAEKQKPQSFALLECMYVSSTCKIYIYIYTFIHLYIHHGFDKWSKTIRVKIYGTNRQENKYNYNYDEISLPSSSSSVS